jgi:hypothetical protein
LKNEAGYEYDSSAGAAARLSFRTASYGPQYGPNLGLDGYQYRSNSSASLYPYAPKPYYSAQSPYGEFADENVDYGLQVSITTSPQFQQTILAPDLGLAPTYTTSNIGRGWTPAPQFPKALFLEPHDSAYSHGQLPYHGSMYGLRMAVPESKGVSLNGSSASLPAPITGSDRVLPLPAANRAVEVGSFLRSTENLLPATQSGYQHRHAQLYQESTRQFGLRQWLHVFRLSANAKQQPRVSVVADIILFSANFLMPSAH